MMSKNIQSLEGVFDQLMKCLPDQVFSDEPFYRSGFNLLRQNKLSCASEVFLACLENDNLSPLAFIGNALSLADDNPKLSQTHANQALNLLNMLLTLPKVFESQKTILFPMSATKDLKVLCEEIISYLDHKEEQTFDYNGEQTILQWMQAEENKRNLPLLDGPNKIAIFLNSNCGGGTLANYFFHRNGLIDAVLRLNNIEKYTPSDTNFEMYNTYVQEFRVFTFCESNYYKTHQKRLIDFIESRTGGRWQIYKFVRNPYRRTLSSFLLYMRHEGVPSYMFEEYRKGGCSFRNFIDLLKRTEANDKTKFYYKIDSHVRRQSHDWELNGSVKFDAVFRNEDGLDEGLRTIYEKVGGADVQGHPPSYFYQNQTNYGNKPSLGDTSAKQQCYADVKFTVVNRDTPIPHYSQFYDAELYQEVSKLFMDDFNLYGYDPQNLNY